MKMKEVVIILILLLPGTASAADCDVLDEKAVQFGTHIPSHMSGRVVIGKGRLQFYSAPNLSCKKSGSFILPGESVDAYLEYKGFTSVLYMNSKTGTEAEGWVLSSKLKETGYGIGPKN